MARLNIFQGAYEAHWFFVSQTERQQTLRFTEIKSKDMF